MIITSFLIASIFFNYKSECSRNSNELFEATYKVQFTNKNNSPIPFGMDIDNFSKELENARPILKFNKFQSLYFVQYIVDHSNINSKVVGSFLSIKKKYYYNSVKRSLTEEINENGLITMLENEDVISWEITNESRIINGLQCFFANGNITTPGFSPLNVSAWFTKKYPIPFGPCGAHGLPGLIVNYQVGNLTYTVSSIKPVLNKSISLDPPKSGSLTKSSDYYQNLKKQMPKNQKKMKNEK